MASARTKYRQLRKDAMKETILILLDILTETEKRQLEQIHMKYFKLIKKTANEILKQRNEIKTNTTT